MSFEGLSSDCLTEAGFCNSDARVIRNSQPWEKTNNPNPVANKKRTIELRQCFQNKTLQLEKLMGQLPKLINCPHWLLLGNVQIDTITDVSFAILLGNQNEYLTVLNYFGMGYKIVSKDQPYSDDVLKCTFDSDPEAASLTRLGKYYSININGKTGIICRSVAIGSGGRYGAMMTTITLLKKAKDLGWPLEIIFAVGCAGGRAEPGQVLNLGQVIVPKDVVEFNRGKVESDPEGQPKFKRDPEMWQTSESWYESLTDSVVHHGEGDCPGISIASGSYEYCSDFVIKDAGFAEKIRRIIDDPKMVAIEMEGVGIATAIKVMKKLGNEVPEFIVVKGISDDADGSAKGAPAPMNFFETRYENVYPDDRQVMAALMSVTLVTRAIMLHREWKYYRATPNSTWSFCQII